jgi:hypothetical protein
MLSMRAAAVLATMGAAAGFARGDGVKVDKFRVWAESQENGWLFTIDYEVEVEDYVVPALELLVSLEHDGMAIANQAGQQVQFALPLGGTDHRDDDAEFKDRTALLVSDLPALPGDRLDAVARVYAPGNPHPYATRRTGVRFVAPEVVTYETTVVEYAVPYYHPGVVVYRTTTYVNPPTVTHVQTYPPAGPPAPQTYPQYPQGTQPYPNNQAYPQEGQPYPPGGQGYPQGAQTATAQPPSAGGGLRYLPPSQPYATRPPGITYADGQHEPGVTSTPPPASDRIPRRHIVPQPNYAGGYPPAEQESE